MSYIKILFLSLVTFLFVSEANASHLIGGNIGYEFIGKFGSNYRYRITLTTYTDCGPTSQIPNPEDPIQPIGIYEHDIQNNPTGGGNKNHLMDLQLNLVSVQLIEPDQPSNCSVGASTCINKGVYEAFVDLPLNFTGYHLVYERCCRNASIVNLVPDEAMSFYCYMSPPLLNNSSPVFTDDPVPFLCVGDTTTILNSAYDPDGDLLTFSFVTPFDGESGVGNPAPFPQNPFLVYPIDPVNYALGYSTAQPFGSGGYSSIGGSTGLTTYYPPSVGDYVVAIEIKEFRNGNLIGITRRDLQLLVLNCPNNPAPVIDANLGTTSDVFTVVEGETLCFTYGYNDPNGNNVTITSGGAIFDPALTSPPASITSPVSGPDTASTEFCWTTDCGQARTAPYQFQISATDDGCPPSSANNVYEIYVDPVPPPTSIIGADVICQFGTETYTTQAIPATTYNWSVTGGNIVADNGSSIDIEWTNVGAASISLTAENQYGCVSEPIDYQVTVTPAPSVEAGNEVSICFGESITLSGSTSANPGFTASWSPSTNIVNGNTLTPTVSPTDTTMYYLTIDLGGGCSNQDSVLVNVNNITVDAGIDTTICSGDSVQLQGSGLGGSVLWSPSGNLSDPAILNPYASPALATEYILSITDALGCIFEDTVMVNVSNSFTLLTSNDTTICSGDCIPLFATGASSYEWSPATGLSDPNASNPAACTVSSETYQVIGFDGACSDTAEVVVTLGITPTVDAGPDESLCIGESIALSASGATNYTWTPSTGLSDPNIPNPDASPVVTTEYIVTGSDALGCTDADTILVTVNQLPTVNAGEDKSVCVSVSNGGSSPTEVLDGSGSGTPTWTPSAGLSDPNIFTPLINPSLDTEYILSVTDANGCSLTDTVLVAVFDEVPTEAGLNDTICPGDTITLGGTPTSAGNNTTYVWSPAGFLDNPNIANPQAFPTTTTMFYVSTNNDTCNGLDSVLITVRTPPAIDAGPDLDVCINDTVQLNATGANNYTWNTSLTLSDSLISNPFAFPSSTETYIVFGSDLFNCSNSDTVTITVNPLPLVNAGLNDTICLNETIQLNATGASSYNWTPSDSLSDPGIANPFANPSLTTDYIVTGIDANLCENSDTVRVVVNSLPIIDAGMNDSICIGETYQLQATGGADYVWTPAVDLNDPNISNPIATNLTTTTFSVIGTDVNGCQNEDTVEIFVNPLPIINAGIDQTICNQDTIPITASGGVSYQWNTQTTLSDSLIASPNFYPSLTTEYIVIGTDQNNCSNSDTVIINVNPLPVIDAGTDVSICLGQSTNLSATGAVSYNWSPTSDLTDPNIASPVANPTTTTEYIVTGEDINLCINRDTVIVTVNSLPGVDAGPNDSICFGEEYNLTASGAVDYIWTPSANLDNPNIATPVSDATTTTTFYVSGTDQNNCSNIDSVEIFIHSLPSVDAGSDVQVCIGFSAQLNASGASIYSWTPGTGLSDINIANPTSTLTDTLEYYVTGTDQNNCSNIDSVTVIVNPLPTIDAGPDQDICIGGSANLLATGADTYVWAPSNTLNNNLIANPVASPDSTTMYIVTATDTNSCVNTDTTIVSVFRINTVPDTAVCIGESVQLEVFGSTGNVYNWTPTGTLSDPNISNPVATPSVNTTYYVSVSNIQGCTDQDSVVVGIYTAPIASFDMEVIPACEGVYVAFTNTSTDGAQFLWDFNDGNSSEEENTSHTFPYEGGFSTTLTVINSNGCESDTTQSDIAAAFDDYYSITLPNVFTPNQDGDNDLFKITVPGKIYECVDLTIFNRWGQIMFRSSGNNTSWDGRTADGQACPDGTYMYTLEINDKKYHGTVTLFR